jgi:pSer/pThr/pTyr-binding forkhead associated (FHA) protein
MDVRLVVQQGGKQKRALRLRAAETIIGRRADCDLKIKSSEVSRRHCLLTIQQGFVTVEDLDSVNGTFLNGQRVSGKQKVRPGDQLEVGPVTFRVEYTMPRVGAAAPQQPEEDLEVLPLVGDDASGEELALAAVDELDALPVVDEDTELAADKLSKKKPSSPSAEDEEAIPFVEELDDAGGWRLPQSEELRDLLSQMDDPKPKPRPGKS